MDGEDFDDDGGEDNGDSGASPGHEPDTLRGDVEQALISLKQDRGDPEPRRTDRGPPLRGRADAGVGGNFEGLERYHDEAKRNGTSLQRAVADYHDVETAIRKDPVSGLSYLAQKIGLDPRQLSAAWAAMNHGPQGNQYAMQAKHQAEYARHSNDIAAFSAKNLHFDEVRHVMAQLVQSGRAHDLKSAYRMAINANPTLKAKVRKCKMKIMNPSKSDSKLGFSAKVGSHHKKTDSKLVSKFSFSPSPAKPMPGKGSMREGMSVRKAK